MFNFTSLFLGNLMPTLAPTFSLGVGMCTTVSGVDTFCDYDTSLGTMITSLGTYAVGGLSDAYTKTVSQLQDTQAYVESLTEEELSELINKLETKDYSCETVEESVVVKKKQFN